MFYPKLGHIIQWFNSYFVARAESILYKRTHIFILPSPICYNHELEHTEEPSAVTPS